jgi:hypothetical protein
MRDGDFTAENAETAAKKTEKEIRDKRLDWQ